MQTKLQIVHFIVCTVCLLTKKALFPLSGCSLFPSLIPVGQFLIAYPFALNLPFRTLTWRISVLTVSAFGFACHREKSKKVIILNLLMARIGGHDLFQSIGLAFCLQFCRNYFLYIKIIIALQVWKKDSDSSSCGLIGSSGVRCKKIDCKSSALPRQQALTLLHYKKQEFRSLQGF
jgi:hypothetical protein